MGIGRWWRIVLGFLCLLATGCGDSVDDMIVQLRHNDPAVRRAAARALGAKPGDVEKAVTSLAGALDDSDLDVRELAAESLGQIGEQAKSGLSALERALNDPQLSVQHSAALAIYRIDKQAKSYQPVLSAALRAGDGPVFLEVGRMGTEAKWAVGGADIDGTFVGPTPANPRASGPYTG
jgi:hypothetical protein